MIPRRFAPMLLLALGACTHVPFSDMVPTTYRFLSDEDVAQATDTLQFAMATAEDGDTYSWENETSGHQGSITPIRSWRTEDGSYCRYYLDSIEIADKAALYGNTACLLDGGTWAWVK